MWLGLVAVQGWLVGRTVSRVPYLDEYCNLGLLFSDDGCTTAALWRQHNEHRIPLPKLAYVLTVRATGYDFRAPAVASSLLLSAAAGLLLFVVREVRGRFRYTDAFIPIVLLHVGHSENIFIGFQLQFVLSTVFVLSILGVVAVPGIERSPIRVGAITALCVLLPLCGANGVAFCPAIGVYLLYLGVVGSSWVRAVAMSGGLAVLATVPVYFHGLQQCDHHPKLSTPTAFVVAAVNFLGMSLGPAARTMQLGNGGVSALGVGATLLTVATLGLLALRARDPGQRPAALGVASVVLGVCCLAAGIGYGRGQSNVLNCFRYCTLASPLAVTAYLAWARFAPAGGRWVGTVLFAVGLLVLVPNTRSGLALSDAFRHDLKRVEYEIREGMPFSFVVDRNPHLFPMCPEVLPTWFGVMRDRGVEPFRRLRPDPDLTLCDVTLAISPTGGVERDGDWYRLRAGEGALTLALPDRRHVYGLLLVYEAEFPIPHYPATVLSWEPGGRVPPRPGYAVIRQLIPTGPGPRATRVLVDKDTDALRIDLFQPGTAIRVHGLAVLDRRD